MQAQADPVQGVVDAPNWSHCCYLPPNPVCPRDWPWAGSVAAVNLGVTPTATLLVFCPPDAAEATPFFFALCRKIGKAYCKSVVQVLSEVCLEDWSCVQDSPDQWSKLTNWKRFGCQEGLHTEDCQAQWHLWNFDNFQNQDMRLVSGVRWFFFRRPGSDPRQTLRIGPCTVPCARQSNGSTCNIEHTTSNTQVLGLHAKPALHGTWRLRRAATQKSNQFFKDQIKTAKEPQIWETLSCRSWEVWQNFDETGTAPRCTPRYSFWTNFSCIFVLYNGEFREEPPPPLWGRDNEGRKASDWSRIQNPAFWLVQRPSAP